MQLGIFAKTFSGDIETNMAAVSAAGLSAVQYNLSIAGIDSVPEYVPTAIVARIATAASRYGVTLAAISGTFNAAHPDESVRRLGIERFPILAATAAELGIPVITLSSGSRHSEDMWAYHPDNSTPQAWADSRTTLEHLAAIAETHNVTIAVEPEHTNVVATAELARTMLSEVGSARLKIVFDAANLTDTGDMGPDAIRAVIDHALALLGCDLALAHAKELVVDRAPAAPGDGALPWPYLIGKLADIGYEGAVITHGLPETGVPTAIRTLGPLIDQAA